MDNPRCQGLGHSSFTHTGFADNDRIILGASAEDLDDALHLHLPANDRVNASVPSLIIQVASIGLEHLQHIILLLQRRLLNMSSGDSPAPFVHGSNHIPNQAALNAKFGQYPMGYPVTGSQKSPQNLLAAHIIML